MNKQKLIFSLFALIFAAFSPLQAENKGIISGIVVDAADGQAVPGAAVWVDELALGDLSGSDGKFIIHKIRPGRYTLKAVLIGYKSYTHYSLSVSDGDTTEIRIAMEETVLPFGEEQVVIGKKPLLDLTQPTTSRTVTRADLNVSAPLEIKTVIEDQVGVSALDNELHIRGGRTYEGDFLVDGVSISDPLVRQGYALNLNPDIVDEIRVVSGGLSAQYGGATSGVIEVATREGGDRLRGNLEYRTDNYGFGSSFDYNSDYLNFEISGPDQLLSRLMKTLGLGDRSYFFIAAGMAISDTHMKYSRNQYSSFQGTSFAPRGDNHWTLFAKWHGWLKDELKMTLSYNGSVNINQDRAVLDTRFRLATYSYGYPFEYFKNLDNYNTFTQFTNQQIFKLETNPQKSSHLQLTFSRMFTNLHSDVNGKHWDEYIAPVDTLPEIIQISPDSSYYTIDEGDGFWDSGDGDLWYDHYLETYSLALKYHGQYEMTQKFSAGLSYEYQTLQMTDIFKPYLGEAGLGLNYDLYKVYPSSFALFVQNKLNFSGAIFDVGARYDVWVPGKYAEDAALSGESPIIGEEIKRIFQNETGSFFGRKARSVFSPRFGLSYLLSNNLTLYMSYNRLAKKPPPQYVYARLLTPAQGAYQLFGNPALSFEKVTTIEVGIKYLPRPGRALSISAYLKDITDYIAATQFVPDPLFPENSYLVYFNLDFAKSRGVEISLVEEVGSYFSLFSDLAFSRADGERSLPADILRGLEARAEGELFTEVPFDWDVPWQFSIGANINVPGDRDVSILGLKLFSDWNLYMKYSARAGKRYTPYSESVDSFGVTRYILGGETNSEHGPYQSWFNISFQKYFDLKQTRLTFFLEINNLFDHKNVTIINPLTGEEYREGDALASGTNFFEVPPEGYRLPIWDNPSQFLTPRTIKLGMGVRF
jgi:outer membrane receptor protein involved in Fe transport